MKRFTETQKWNDPWFRQLKPEAKLLWGWLLDNCDNAGVIEPDLGLASFQIGLAMGNDTLSALGDRVRRLKGGKLWLPKFISFQYGKLSAECRAHQPVFLSIEKHGLQGVLEGYAKGIDTLEDRVQEKEKAKDKDLCTLEQAKAQAPVARMSADEAEFWWHTRAKAGWTTGTAGGGSRPITSWQSDMQTSKGWVQEMLAKSKAAGGEKKLW